MVCKFILLNDVGITKYPQNLGLWKIIHEAHWHSGHFSDFSSANYSNLREDSSSPRKVLCTLIESAITCGEDRFRLVNFLSTDYTDFTVSKTSAGLWILNG